MGQQTNSCGRRIAVRTNGSAARFAAFHGFICDPCCFLQPEPAEVLPGFTEDAPLRVFRHAWGLGHMSYPHARWSVAYTREQSHVMPLFRNRKTSQSQPQPYVLRTLCTFAKFTVAFLRWHFYDGIFATLAATPRAADAHGARSAMAVPSLLEESMKLYGALSMGMQEP